MSNWVKVAKSHEIAENSGLEVVAGDRIVAIFRSQGELFALDGICPHNGGPLAQGQVHNHIVTCPWHGWQFNVTNGRHCLNANLNHPKFAVRTEGDDVLIELPD